MSAESQIRENVARVQERIAEAAVASGRAAADVQLVAVTKYVGAGLTAALLDAGCATLGESRPQQLRSKAAEPVLAAARWHLIGHLQRNKVRPTLPLVDLIHSVDSLRLLKAIDAAVEEDSPPARVLLEVNCSGDKEKHGLTAEGLLALLAELPNLSRVEVRGLMTMAARTGGQETAAHNFAALRELRDAAASQCPETTQLTELSMGMSHDFEVAIREGATIVRIGSLLLEGVDR